MGTNTCRIYVRTVKVLLIILIILLTVLGMESSDRSSSHRHHVFHVSRPYQVLPRLVLRAVQTEVQAHVCQLPGGCGRCGQQFSRCECGSACQHSEWRDSGTYLQLGCVSWGALSSCTTFEDIPPLQVLCSTPRQRHTPGIQ